MQQVSINIDLSSYVKNVINTKVKLFMKFEGLPIIDEISGQAVQILNDQPPFIEEAIFGNGLRMRPRSTISVPLLFDNPAEFSIGFWLHPAWISPTISPLTNLPVYYRMSLMDKSSYLYTSATGFIGATDTTFSIYEESIENKFNILKVLLQATDGTQITVKTEAYTTEKPHHFWISYYGPTRKLDIFIDGSPVQVFSEDGLSIPQSLNNSPSVPFRINSSAVGYGSLVRNNFGLLDEVVLINQAISDSSVIARVINLGVEYAIDQSLSYKEIVSNAFAFDDPTALGVTSVMSNGKNFYAGRNDGAVFRGDRTMWQVRRDFASEDEIKFIKKNTFSADSSITVENGSLKLYKASVRI